MQNGTFVRIFIASPGDVYQERDEACRRGISAHLSGPSKLPPLGIALE
jgi:hypothetical protein